jgi:hypothetical protein
MRESESLQQFVGSLQMAEELLRVEKDLYPNSARKDITKAVQGLRGGATVLIVAAFENFLRTAFEEHLALLSKNLHIGSNVSFDKLPEKMRVSCFYLTLEQAMKGPPFQRGSSQNSTPCRHL